MIINVKISFAEFLIFGYTLRERKEKPLPVRFCRAVKLCRGCKTEYRIIQRFSEEPKDKADAMAGLDGSRRTVLASAAGMKRSCIFIVSWRRKIENLYYKTVFEFLCDFPIFVFKMLVWGCPISGRKERFAGQGTACSPFVSEADPQAGVQLV